MLVGEELVPADGEPQLGCHLLAVREVREGNHARHIELNEREGAHQADAVEAPEVVLEARLQGDRARGLQSGRREAIGVGEGLAECAALERELVGEAAGVLLGREELGRDVRVVLVEAQIEDKCCGRN